MRLIVSMQQMQDFARKHRAQVPALYESATIGFVPTMGALHAGHLSLLERARKECSLVVASIFVNPLQFGPNEDFALYPRTFDADRAALEAASVDVLFAPAAAEMYPEGAGTTITVHDLSSRLDGASRPGHFSGVATVVAKLFHLVQPHRAYFGQKDAAQLAVLRQMVRDLDFDLNLVACPIIRGPDGLALSSRNRHLSAAQRADALTLPHTLRAIEAAITHGDRDTSFLLALGTTLLQQQPSLRLDYLAIVNPDTLLPVQAALPGTLIALAATIGTTRLIDNILAP